MESEFQQYFNSSCGTVLHSAITYVIPILQLAAIVINLFNATVFKQWKNPLYRYLSVNSTVVAVWLILYFGFAQSICINSHDVVFTFAFQLIQFLTLYFARVIGMTSALINIQISFDRFVILTEGFIRKNNKIRIIIFIMASFAFYTPMYFIVHIYQIEKCTNCSNLDTNNSTREYFFFAYFSEFIQKHVEIKQFVASLQFLLTLTYLSIMIVLNVLIYKKYKSSKSTTNYTLRVKFYNNSEYSSDLNISSNTLLTCKAYENNRITLMVFWISCVFIVDQVFSIVVPTIAFVAYGNRFRPYFKSLVFILLFRSVSSILNTLFYYIFYHEYRKIMKQNLALLMFLIIFTTSVITYVLYLLYNHY